MQNQNFEKGIAPIVIIVVSVVAVIGLGVVAWFTIRPGINRQAPTPTPTVDPNAPQRTTDKSSPMINMTAQNNSGLIARYQLTAVGAPSGISSQTKVTIAVSNAPQGVSMPAHVHTGSCANLGGVKYPLSNIVNGSSVTTLNASILQLKLGLPLAINIHKSVAESSVYVACADLNAGGELDALYNTPAR